MQTYSQKSSTKTMLVHLCLKALMQFLSHPYTNLHSNTNLHGMETNLRKFGKDSCSIK